MNDFIKIKGFEYVVIFYCASYLAWRTLWDIFISDQRGGLRGPICWALSMVCAWIMYQNHPGRIVSE